MIPLSVDEIRSLASGELRGGTSVTGMQIDTRRIRPGDLFVAVGRGREFLEDARAAGAAATLVPDDAFSALAAIAGAVRERSSARVVGITGSTGKTSTKDILAALCAPVRRTVATEASFNAELGVPLTLCRLEPDTEVCLVELGMRGFGQIAELCAFARPHVGVITAIGPVHLERVGSVDGVARAKAELLDALPVGAPAVVPEAHELEPYLREDLDVRRVEPVNADLDAEGTQVAFAGRRIRFSLSARHQAQNALTALYAYDALGLPLDRAGEGAACVELSRWRGDELALAGGGFVLNDAWNANPVSVAAALRHLAERGRGCRQLAVLGGMAELGEHAERFHREIGEQARGLGVEVLAVGELARGYGAAEWVPDAETALARLRDVVRPGDAVLVKASRAIGLEGIAPALAKHSL
ncbi:MAG: UDP-N-acetylmuramoyl-tripeptide--D-alanyl-D-alanine ligase [Actinomycetota bacterium]|nr:UDP-N-acetylmuramoyl-tripeptide--D-alanyl-D-alanine ligase [Actinomycetota bacterium]